MRRRPLAPTAPVLASILLALCAACGRARSQDPALQALERVLAPADRLVLARVLDPDTGDRIAAVVRPASGKPELRIYERRGGQGDHVLSFKTQQGDLFHNLSLEDVDGDGREEIVTAWTGGHLEILDVLARDDAGAWRSLFQNAGQEIERRYGPAGAVEFWITSRTYEEKPGQPAAYGVSVYRWDGRGFSEVRRPAS